MAGFLSKEETYLFGTGKYYHSYLKFGAHLMRIDSKEGVLFTLYAPGVRQVCVIGDFNGWVNGRSPMHLIDNENGIWQLFIPYIGEGALYKYCIECADGKQLFKADPYAFKSELRPGTASVVYDTNWFTWTDAEYMSSRKNHESRPKNIYEVHLGSWKRKSDGGFLSYTELAETLVPYAKEMGYNYLELMPLMEHPLDASWGYQVTSYYAPTSRYGTPKELMAFIDACHNAGIGVIMDWVPSHFCRDSHGLGNFTGNKLYESGDHVQWGTYKFDYSRPQVRSFLISNAMYWLDLYHADGLRVDGVSSMLYLNFCGDRPDARNEKGGLEDLSAVSFLKEFNREVKKAHPDVFTVAEEATAYPHVTGEEGLGFTYKWNMGWMNDTLKYFAEDPIYRKYDHKLLNFSMLYNYDENFILPLSHDEVVHGKRSLLGRMPGDYWRQFAGLRLLYLFQMTHPGAKLSFMGNENAPYIEWREYESLEWFMLSYDMHRNFSGYIKELNHLYASEPALFELDGVPEGFRWINADDSERSILTFERKSKDETLLVILNFTPAYYGDFETGVSGDPDKNAYVEVFNSDCSRYGGSGKVTTGQIKLNKAPMNGKNSSVKLSVPPLGGMVLKLTELEDTTTE